jgi:hypothetical protein
MTHPPVLPELQLPELLAPQFMSAFRKQYLLTQIQAPQVSLHICEKCCQKFTHHGTAFKAGNKKHSNGTPSTLERIYLAFYLQKLINNLLDILIS